jgi:predicted RNA-binding protein YlxR (DUF448 family)
MESMPQKELTRIAYYEGELTVDYTGRAKGRGVYLCSNPECLEKAKKKRALQRSFQTDLKKEALEAVFSQIEGGMNDDQK